MLPPHSRPIEMLSPQLRIEREKINFVVLLRLIKSRQYTRFGIDPAASINNQMQFVDVKREYPICIPASAMGRANEYPMLKTADITPAATAKT
jgi:hypothetical protein